MGLSLGLMVAAMVQAGPPPRYTAQIIQHTCAPPFPPSLTSGMGLNNHGQVCGYYWPCDGSSLEKIGFVWTPETGTVPIAAPPGAIAVQPEDINDSGQITGTVLIDGSYRGFLLSDGKWTFIEPLCTTDWSFANALNADGSFIGDRQAPFVCAFPMWSFLVDDGLLTDLVWQAGGTDAYDVNLFNQVGGAFDGPAIFDPVPFIWSAGKFSTLAMPRGAAGATVRALSDCSAAVGIAGYSDRSSPFGYVFAGVLWVDHDPQVLNSLPGYRQSHTRDINTKQNSIVGLCHSDSPTVFRATLWKDGEVFDLNTLIDEPGFILGSAGNINDKGQILCGATDSSGENFAVLLTPSGFAMGDLNFDGAVSGLDLAILLAAWGTCADVCNCPADLDSNQIVNGFDLALLLASWT